MAQSTVVQMQSVVAMGLIDVEKKEEERQLTPVATLGQSGSQHPISN